MLRKVLLSLVLVSGSGTLCLAQVTLEHKFVEGADYTVESTDLIEQKLVINGTDIDTSGTTKSVTKASVGKRDAQGNLRVSTKIESLKINMIVQGTNYDFDSENPDAKGDSQLEALRPIHKAIAKRESTAVFDKEGKVTAVESDASLINALPLELQSQVKNQLDPNTLKEAANAEIEQLNRDPIKKGDTWQRTANANLGAGQVMTFKNEYTYDGTVEKDGHTLDKILVKTLETDYSLQDSPLPLTIKNSELKPAESDGAIYFDRKEGRVVESNSSVRITGELTFVINEMNLPAKLDLKLQKSTIVKP